MAEKTVIGASLVNTKPFMMQVKEKRDHGFPKAEMTMALQHRRIPHISARK